MSNYVPRDESGTAGPLTPYRSTAVDAFAARADQFERRLLTLAAAYIKENSRPDCLESHRFRVTLPNSTEYAPTREEAMRRVLGLAEGRGK